MRRVLAALLLLAWPVRGLTGDRMEGKPFATRSVVYARHGMVAAAHPLAAQIGVDVLKRGGSAVDAAIAMNAALGFLEPISCGIGGDLFALVWDAKTGRLYGLNGSGRAPRALTADKVRADPDGTIPPYTPWAWTVPGGTSFPSSRRSRPAPAPWCSSPSRLPCDSTPPERPSIPRARP